MEWLKELFGVSYTDVNQFLVRMGTNLIVCIIILFAGFWLAKMLSKGIKNVLRKSNTDEGLVTFLTSFLSMVMKILVVITAISQIGIEMTSFVALLGAAGLAIGMAFSGTLSNFAGGVMILVLKPFKVGDLIMAQGEKGIVREIQIFNTYLYTVDNKVIILPNGAVANGNITNFTKAELRRVDWVISISYGDDIDVAKKALNQFALEDERILKEPEIYIGVALLNASSVDLTLRVWTHVDNYNEVFFDMNEKVYREFKNLGLNFPFPQMDVHVKNQNNG
ncbi:MAG: mechanosensitive ion channel [Crocinitomicaceae bacterium]|nr:mechanosensitive ion channel [Crocinitomicaceae bacterium]MDP5010273.1 mechanosensitive ion channel [Crocinitomicaceae bacterium]MDP5099015.1 mechanosensitive ion channel [Crocinitomicaceae bacterium]